MLYVNNERVKLDDPNSKYAQEFQEKKKEIERVGYPVVLRVLPTWISGSMTTDGQWVQHVPAQFINFTAIEEREDEGSVEWRYSPTPARVKNGETIFQERGKRFFENNRRTEKLGKDKIDLLFFLIYKSGKHGKIFEMVDDRAESEERVEKKRQQAKLTEVLYGANSPLTGNLDRLKTVAQSWGIESRGKTEAQMLDSLEMAVLQGEKYKTEKGTRGVDDFIEDTKLGEMTQIRAMINQAVEQRIIGFDQSTYTYGWHYLDKNGKNKYKIMGLAPKSEDIKEQKLAEHLHKHKPALDTLKEALGIPVQEDFDIEKLRDYDHNTLVEFGKRYGIKVVGRNKEEVYREFEEKFSEKTPDAE
jgi:hypothetical protein